jgi:DNA-binding NarL/FixJ family response regulator
MKRVSIIEDNIITAEILMQLVNNQSNYFCEKYYTNPADFLDNEESPDIILLDIMMPQMSGIEAIDKILSKTPNTSIVINSSKDDLETILEAMKKGIAGYIDKNSFTEDLSEVFKSLENGGGFMTPSIAKKIFAFFGNKNKVLDALSEREHEIAKTILDGLSYKLIADELYISIDTVRAHIRNIYKKLNINSKSELFKMYNSNTTVH